MAVQDVKPTRSELQDVQKKIKLSQNGYKLLKMKRDGLILEFFKILNQARGVREELDAAYEFAVQKSNLASAVDGSFTLKSASFAVDAVPTIELKSTNIMGVVVPKIHGSGVKKPLHERGYGLIGTDTYIDEVADAYEVLVEKIIVAAELETTMKRLLEDIEKTKRRVNALEFKVIPEFQEQVKFIRLRLEEMERESMSSLKKIKQKKAAEAKK
ncbi:V-type ATP synthase subunit D [Methanosarcinaceae archaeon Ag5]|uniref:A-type ATP synthase subunit D n=1 Tax=Methanolapillus africanus TaxID=3028297 RepID=A0AAE4MKB7_9EURY|nr:V-type ATP synthase subunit D [Methanosarcinaceae archaeon Ag5]